MGLETYFTNKYDKISDRLDARGGGQWGVMITEVLNNVGAK